MQLTERQHEIAALVMEGLTEQEIADRLHLSKQTIKNHKQRIYAKLGARNAMEMANIIRGEAA